jgi:hypothetical protein
VILGRQAYGGSALLRGLADLPVLPALAGAGKLQVVQLDDVVEAIAFFLGPEAPSKVEVELAGPEQHSFEEGSHGLLLWSSKRVTATALPAAAAEAVRNERGDRGFVLDQTRPGAAMSTSPADHSDRHFPVSAGILFGLGLGGFFDGIVLHQLLQWHHMLSSWYPINSIENLELNTLWDGIQRYLRIRTSRVVRAVAHCASPAPLLVHQTSRGNDADRVRRVQRG